MKKTNKKMSKLVFSDRTFNVVLTAIVTLFLIIVLYPLIYVVSSSFSSGNAVTSGKVLLWPVDFSLDGYQIVFSHKAVWMGYANTIFYTIVGTVLNMVLTIMTAYPLSRKQFQGKAFMTVVFSIPMFFGGGLIPSYILMSNLKLINTRMVLLVVGALSIYNMILMRTFFQSSIPNELLESAKLDGISDFGYMIKIVLPLSKAVISVISLYYLVDHWNSYFSAMIYLRDRELFPLQLVLRDILNSTKIDATMIGDSAVLAKLTGAADVMKYSLIVVSTVPMLILYPFVQKFFEKGVMLGSVKG